METMTGSSNATSRYFPVFDLPAELRLMIWHFVLLGDWVVVTIPFIPVFEWDPPRDDGNRLIRPPEATWTYPALLHTCREIRHDAIKICFRWTQWTWRAEQVYDPRFLRCMKSLDQNGGAQYVHFINFPMWPMRSLRGQLYCMERFIAYIDDSIPRHQFNLMRLDTRIPLDWKEQPSSTGGSGTVKTLGSMFEDPLAQELGGGRGVDLDAGLWRVGSMSVEPWTNARRLNRASL